MSGSSQEKTDSRYYEINFDALVGPTHNYGGLSYGNIASEKNYGLISNPKEAALQALDKMWFNASTLKLPQAVLPPQLRPHLQTLRQLGFAGSDKDILEEVLKKDPHLLSLVSSSAFMWAANAATMTPSCDSSDNKVHFTIANLVSKFHRSIEARQTADTFNKIFSSKEHFIHHPPFLYGNYFADEGAANHTRFCSKDNQKGIHFFVYGRSSLQTNKLAPQLYPARQTLEAQKAIVQNHKIDPHTIFFAQQNPEAIDAGVFHNDVASVGNQNVFFYHEKAFVHTAQVINNLKNIFEKNVHEEFFPILVKESEISLNEAVKTYIFNSQLVTVGGSKMALIAPQECYESKEVKSYLDNLIKQSFPIKKVYYKDVRHSMKNGGGPACLRLRVVLNSDEMKAMNQAVLLTEGLYHKLKRWIHDHYRDSLTVQDLADPLLLQENSQALEQLNTLLQLV